MSQESATPARPQGGYATWRYRYLVPNSYDASDATVIITALTTDTNATGSNIRWLLDAALARGLDEDHACIVAARALLRSYVGGDMTASGILGEDLRVAGRLLGDYFVAGFSVQSSAYATHLLEAIRREGDAAEFYRDHKLLKLVLFNAYDERMGISPAGGAAMLEHVLPRFFAALPAETEQLCIASLLAGPAGCPWSKARCDIAMRCRPSLFVVYAQPDRVVHDSIAELLLRGVSRDTRVPWHLQPCLVASLHRYGIGYRDFSEAGHVQAHRCDTATCSWWASYNTHRDMLQGENPNRGIFDCKNCPL